MFTCTSKTSVLVVFQGKGHLQRVSYNAASPPVSPRLPSVADAVIEESGDEDRTNSFGDIPEHQQVAMQQEERVLTEQIESLQKEKYEQTRSDDMRAAGVNVTCVNLDLPLQRGVDFRDADSGAASIG